MRAWFLMPLLLAWITPAAAQQRNGAEVYRVTETGGGLGIFVDQTIVFLRAGGGTVPMRWVVERVRRDRNWCGRRSDGKCAPLDERRHDWIDGDACPQLIAVLRDLSKIPPPGFSDPERPESWMVSDSTLLTVEGRPAAPIVEKGSWPRQIAQTLSISEYSGPYQDWWHKGEQVLAGCWKAEAPRAAGKPIQPVLPEPR